MKTRFVLPLVLSAALAALPSTAAAQPKVEVGGALASVFVSLEDDDIRLFGVPSASFGIFNPGVYGSFFLGSNFAIEPQLGILWISAGGESEHALSAAAQFDYFFAGTERPSPYAFASVGIYDESASGDNPKSLAAGVGYRIPVGDRLTFRIDARYLHLTTDEWDHAGDALTFGFSIGGIFGR